ncbi:MAG TPA: nucleotide exchange factor GrpE [Armatimonadota bacterium]|nr:nucleotide exchange factor GrpE [Armatimonadota bacterium]
MEPETESGAAATAAENRVNDGDGVDPGQDGGNGTVDTSGSERIATLEREAEEWRDRCLRTAAEMENLRRRAQREAEEDRKRGNERLISELLPALDNFSRALESADQTSNLEALKTGVELIYRQLSDVLSRQGLERIEALGQPFDPNLHEAIMQVEPQEGQSPHEVVEELRAGFRLNDRVLRPTLVKVTSG